MCHGQVSQSEAFDAREPQRRKDARGVRLLRDTLGSACSARLRTLLRAAAGERVQRGGEERRVRKQAQEHGEHRWNGARVVERPSPSIFRPSRSLAPDYCEYFARRPQALAFAFAFAFPFPLALALALALAFAFSASSRPRRHRKVMSRADVASASCEQLRRCITPPDCLGLNPPVPCVPALRSGKSVCMHAFTSDSTAECASDVPAPAPAPAPARTCADPDAARNPSPLVPSIARTLGESVRVTHPP